MSYFVLRQPPLTDSEFVAGDFDAGVLTHSHQLVEGKSMASGWPEDVVVYAPAAIHTVERTRLSDFVASTTRWLIVNACAKDVLTRSCSATEIEHLPVRIAPRRYDQAGAILEDPFWIANPLMLVAAVDASRSHASVGAIDDIGKIDQLALRPEVMESGPAIFRLKEMPALVFVRSELKAALEARALSGVELVPAEEFRTVHRVGPRDKRYGVIKGRSRH